MKADLTVEGPAARYIVTGLPTELQDAARALEFRETSEGWVREFHATSPLLEVAFDNFRGRFAHLFRQRAGLEPVAWEGALESLLERVSGESVDWWLVGSASLAVRGISVKPKDVDLVVDDEGAARLGRLLREDLIEPVEPVGAWVSRWFGRSFPGACLEWAGGITDLAEAEGPSDFGRIARDRRERVWWRGFPVYVPPLDLVLEVNRRRGRTDTVQAIEGSRAKGSAT